MLFRFLCSIDKLQISPISAVTYETFCCPIIRSLQCQIQHDEFTTNAELDIARCRNYFNLPDRSIGKWINPAVTELCFVRGTSFVSRHPVVALITIEVSAQSAQGVSIQTADHYNHRAAAIESNLERHRCRRVDCVAVSGLHRKLAVTRGVRQRHRLAIYLFS
jgi:hypothetical protein